MQRPSSAQPKFMVNLATHRRSRSQVFAQIAFQQPPRSARSCASSRPTALLTECVRVLITQGTFAGLPGGLSLINA